MRRISVVRGVGSNPSIVNINTLQWRRVDLIARNGDTAVRSITAQVMGIDGNWVSFQTVNVTGGNGVAVAWGEGTGTGLPTLFRIIFEAMTFNWTYEIVQAEGG